MSVGQHAGVRLTMKRRGTPWHAVAGRRLVCSVYNYVILYRSTVVVDRSGLRVAPHSPKSIDGEAPSRLQYCMQIGVQTLLHNVALVGDFSSPQIQANQASQQHKTI